MSDTASHGPTPVIDRQLVVFMVRNTRQQSGEEARRGVQQPYPEPAAGRTLDT
ncbi:MAG: hypothetical protein OES13_08285 [Acidimicrobiia bacterium]|nr:hypothetical protein [Acidimicrobiia bacterium]